MAGEETRMRQARENNKFEAAADRGETSKPNTSNSLAFRILDSIFPTKPLTGEQKEHDLINSLRSYDSQSGMSMKPKESNFFSGWFSSRKVEYEFGNGDKAEVIEPSFFSRYFGSGKDKFEKITTQKNPEEISGVPELGMFGIINKINNARGQDGHRHVTQELSTTTGIGTPEQNALVAAAVSSISRGGAVTPEQSKAAAAGVAQYYGSIKSSAAKTGDVARAAPGAPASSAHHKGKGAAEVGR